MGRYHPKAFFLLAAAAMTGSAAVALWMLGVPALWAYLAAVNLTAIVFYALDKRRASAGRPRIPEQTLRLLAMLGGTPAALAARAAFRHKTRKKAFTATLLAIGTLQITLLLCYLKYTRGRP